MAILERDLTQDNIIRINNYSLKVKEYERQRVITFKDIDTVHERPEGTARKRFSDNKERFIKNIDYFEVSPKNGQSLESYGFSKFAPNGILITESGYLMLVKSLQDDLAWRVQRELVNNYFRSKNLVNNLSPQLQLLINMELKQKELETTVTETKQQITSIKENIIADYEDWRKWANNRVKAIGATLGDYRRAYNESYEELEVRARCNLKRRLENKIKRLEKQGVGKKKISNTNYLDVIGENKRLQEIYTAIVKEMCVKYL